MACACLTSSAGAPATYGTESEAPERVKIQFHNAELERSFAKIGIMDPYVVASVDGKVVYRSGVATWSHKNPTWNMGFGLRTKEIPGSITVAVWNQNRLRKDVLCGSVTVPLADEVGSLQEKEFALTKRSKHTGKIRLSMTLMGKTASILRSSGSTLGAEMDHIVQWIEEGASNDPFMRGRSLELVEEHENEESGDDEAPVAEAHPTLLNGQLAVKAPLEAGFRHSTTTRQEPVKPDEPIFTPQQSMLSATSAELTKMGSQEAKADEVKLEVAEEEGGLPEPLAGHWECVDTFGLEEFLIAAGVGAFQRRFAMSARWPSWDFKILEDRVKFINHSALGDLNEEIMLDGTKYTWRDGKLNLLQCNAKWTKSADGGCLRIWRAHEKASFHEDRVVSGDTLTFTLYGENGTSWGRKFKRSN